MPRQPRGVPTPLTVHVHPYPTRFHGGIWKRPVFGLPQVRRPYNTIQPSNMYPSAELSRSATNPYRNEGLSGCACKGGLGTLYDTGSGIFRVPESDGGGVFNRAIAGTDATTQVAGLVYGAAACAAAFALVYFGAPLVQKAMK